MEENIAHKNERRRKARRSRAPYIVGLAVLVLVVSFAVTALVIGRSDFHIRLNGTADMSVEYGTVFEDPGAGGYLDKSRVSSAKAEGTVDTGRLGEYEIVYSSKFLWRSAELTRKVHVVDTTAPTIVLQHTDDLTLPGKEYKEEGFHAQDNLDGDITHLVQRMVSNGVVYYRVSDSSGNVTEVTRPIRYGDKGAPELKLLGGDKITAFVGGIFADPGYTATDDADGDITSKVQVSGNYDMNTPGTYTLTYTVTDSAGNTTTATRTLEVLKSNPPIVNPTGKTIYLTFDDGPSQHTVRLLEVLEKYNVKATFFVVGRGKMDLLDDIVKGGHAIGLHTMTHDYDKVYASEEAFMKEITTLRQIVLDRTGVDTTLIRFPGGSSNAVSKKYNKGIMTRLTKLVEAEGYQYFDWNVSSGDAGDVNTTEAVYQNVINGVKNRKVSVVLQHDSHGFSVDAVERIIQWGLANGYTFEKLTPTSPNAHHRVFN